MNAYKAYFDRQGVSPGLHEKLVSLGTAPAQNAPSPLRNPEENEPPARIEMPLRKGLLAPVPTQKEPKKGAFGPAWAWLSLAACAALVLGVGFFAMNFRDVEGPSGIAPAPVQTTRPMEQDDTDTPGPVESQPLSADAATDTGAFTLREQEAMDVDFYFMPALNFVDATNSPELAASIALPQGSFEVDLTLEDLQMLFFGPNVKAMDLRTDLPWSLYWGGYTVWMRAMYDGEGQLWQLTVHGEREGRDFTLTLSPGRMPPTCLVEPGGADAVEVQGIMVSSRLKEYDRNGDGKTDIICTSEFLTDAYGCRFENRGTPQLVGEDYDRDAAIWFNTLFVRYALTGDGLYLDHIAQAEAIPAWREENFSTLAAAREETDFAPYLPETAPVSWSEFHGHLSYQKGNYNYLFVRWTRMYDNIEVNVYLPEDPSGYPQSKTPVDVNVPESYDYRLYTIPLSESVPREYVLDFYSVTFRAQDMSLEVVKARETGHDTGGSSFRFYVLHENGVVVSYSCDGLTAEEVWALVEPTL